MKNEYRTYQYIEDPSITDIEDNPKYIVPSYFPSEIILKTKVKVINNKDQYFESIQEFPQNLLSSYLYAVSEPILYNYYLGYTIFRLLWIRSFNLPIIITISELQGKIELKTKILSKHPEYSSLSNLEKTQNKYLKIDYKENIQEVSNDDWMIFFKLLNNANFWITNPTDEDRGFDGSEWIIEGHTKDRYWFVERWSPNKKSLFRQCGEFLISLSGVNEKIY